MSQYFTFHQSDHINAGKLTINWKTCQLYRFSQTFFLEIVDSLTFPKYIYCLNLETKKIKFLLGVPLSAPLENVEIYFSKIDLKIFASDTIFILQNCFILTKWGFCKKIELKQLRFDWVMNFSVATRFFLRFPKCNSNGHEIHNFWPRTLIFWILQGAIYIYKVVS